MQLPGYSVLTKKQAKGKWQWSDMYISNYPVFFQNVYLVRSPSTKMAEFESSLKYWISPQSKKARFSSVSSVISARNEYQLPGFENG